MIGAVAFITFLFVFPEHGFDIPVIVVAGSFAGIVLWLFVWLFSGAANESDPQKHATVK